MSNDEKENGWRRREVLGAMAAATATVAAVPLLKRTSENAMSTRMPVIYMPHGGGPWPFVDLGGLVSKAESEALASYLRDVPKAMPQTPTAMLVISAHWEEAVPTVMVSDQPTILYDYYGFPPESYRITWPAPGSRDLATRVRALLDDAGIRSAEDATRGFDHGTFIPLKVTYPDASVPTIQLSLRHDLDPARHIAIGKALAPLRDEGVLIVGSGMSFHNLRAFGRGDTAAFAHADTFDAWLQNVVKGEAVERDAALTRWADAPSARQSHPREEHLLPLMVVAGAAGVDRGHVPYSGTFGGARITAVHFG